MSVVRQVCNKVSVLDKGEISAKGKVEDIFLNPPKSLRDLLGEEEEEEVLPMEGINIRLIYSKEDITSSIVSTMARKLDIDFSIVWGKLEKYRENVLGSVVINTKECNENIIKDYLKEIAVDYEVIENGR